MSLILRSWQNETAGITLLIKYFTLVPKKLSSGLRLPCLKCHLCHHGPFDLEQLAELSVSVFLFSAMQIINLPTSQDHGWLKREV